MHAYIYHLYIYIYIYKGRKNFNFKYIYANNLFINIDINYYLLFSFHYNMLY